MEDYGRGMTQVPTTISLEGLEAKWDAAWAGQRTYRFDRTKERHDIFAIDTPPPTVSGSLHLGSAFGYIQTDAIARFHRMSGQEVFYPMGWDDNGLPTERRVQNYFGVRCEPSAPYDPKLNVVPATDGQPQLPISRRNFVELCQQLTAQDEQVFEHVWRMLGLSVDWTLTYATIGERSRRVSQLAFLRNLQRGEANSCLRASPSSRTLTTNASPRSSAWKLPPHFSTYAFRSSRIRSPTLRRGPASR